MENNWIQVFHLKSKPLAQHWHEEINFFFFFFLNVVSYDRISCCQCGCIRSLMKKVCTSLQQSWKWTEEWKALTFGSRWPGRSWSRTCAWGPGHQRGDRKVHLQPQKAQGPNGEDFPSEMKESYLWNTNIANQIVLSNVCEDAFRAYLGCLFCVQSVYDCQIVICLQSISVLYMQTNLWLLLEEAQTAPHMSQRSSCSHQLGVQICYQKAKTSFNIASK